MNPVEYFFLLWGELPVKYLGREIYGDMYRESNLGGEEAEFWTKRNKVGNPSNSHSYLQVPIQHWMNPPS